MALPSQPSREQKITSSYLASIPSIFVQASLVETVTDVRPGVTVQEMGFPGDGSGGISGTDAQPEREQQQVVLRVKAGPAELQVPGRLSRSAYKVHTRYVRALSLLSLLRKRVREGDDAIGREQKNKSSCGRPIFSECNSFSWRPTLSTKNVYLLRNSRPCPVQERRRNCRWGWIAPRWSRQPLRTEQRQQKHRKGSRETEASVIPSRVGSRECAAGSGHPRPRSDCMDLSVRSWEYVRWCSWRTSSKCRSFVTETIGRDERGTLIVL